MTKKGVTIANSFCWDQLSLCLTLRPPFVWRKKEEKSDREKEFFHTSYKRKLREIRVENLKPIMWEIARIILTGGVSRIDILYCSNVTYYEIYTYNNKYLCTGKGGKQIKCIQLGWRKKRSYFKPNKRIFFYSLSENK